MSAIVIREMLISPVMFSDVRAIRQAAHWAFKLCSVETSPIEYAGYFRRRGPTAETVELQRKMAHLHTETVRKEVSGSSFIQKLEILFVVLSLENVIIVKLSVIEAV